MGNHHCIAIGNDGHSHVVHVTCEHLADTPEHVTLTAMDIDLAFADRSR